MKSVLIIILGVLITCMTFITLAYLSHPTEHLKIVGNVCCTMIVVVMILLALAESGLA